MKRHSPSWSDVFSLMNLLAHFMIMDTPKSCRDMSIFQFYFSIITNCQSPRLFLNSKFILIGTLYIYISYFSFLYRFRINQVFCFLCNSVYGNFPGLNGQAAFQQQCALCVCGYKGIRDSHSRRENHGLTINVNDGRKKSFNIVLKLVIGKKKKCYKISVCGLCAVLELF